MENQSEDFKSKLLICIGGLCGIIFSLGFIAAVIAFYVFGIMFLVDDYDLCKECEGSSLWAYILTTLILSLCNGGSAKKKERTNIESLLFFILTFILNTSMGIWGGVELWVKSCATLSGSNIWIFGTWTFGLQMTCCLLSLIAILIVCCKLSSESNTRTEIV